VSSALTLYGMSLLFGLAGTTQIADLARLTPTPLLRVAISLVVAGFGFKLGLAPFQFWIPDTYEGAPTPVASFFSVAPKAAGMMALAQLLLLGLPGQTEAWLPGLIVVAVGTMATGHLLALPQTHLKRMLGNSGVAQMGTMLLGLFAAATLGARGHGLDALLFYVVAYLAANTGLFLVVEAIGQHAPADSRDTLASLAGLHRRSPALAAAALLCLLSLAGIPFAVGFWAKLYVFLAAWQAGHTWLVLIGAGFSVLGLFYYLRVARSMYLGEPTDVSPVRVGLALRLAVAVCALATAGLGLYPRPVVEAAAVAAQAWQGQSMPRLASIPASPGTLADSPRLTQVK
jgi:NADH-quinone oxidoreductase subunit N